MEFENLLRTIFFCLLLLAAASFAFSSLSPLAFQSPLLKGGFLLLSLPLAYGLSMWLSQLLSQATPDVTVKATEVSPTEVEFLFIKSLFISLGRLAASDKHVCEHEQAYVKQLINQLNLCENYSDAAKAYFQTGINDDVDWLSEVGAFVRATTRKRELQQVFFETLVELAEQNGRLTRNEFVLLHAVRELLFKSPYLDGLLQGLEAKIEEQDKTEQSQRQSKSSANQQGQQADYQCRTSRLDKRTRQALRLLGLRDDASVLDIKKRYRQLIKAHHPDRLIAEGLPEELLEKATERAAKINKAYRLLKQSMNFR